MAGMLMRSISVAFCLMAGVMCAKGWGEDTVQNYESSLSVISADRDMGKTKDGAEPQVVVEAGVGGGNNCWEDAARMYGVDAWLLYSIAVKESSLNPKAYNRNDDGTYDISLMQINSSHLKKLATFGIREEHLWEPCFNIHVGAWVLADSIRQFGSNWIAVGAYNAGNKRTQEQNAKRASYANSVYRIYRRHVRMLDH